MSIEEQLERARQWLEAADNDLRSAEALKHAGIYNNACFFAQQAAEKAFKGFLVAVGKGYPRSHSLEMLAGMVPADPGLVNLEPARLDRYYIAPRYPEALPPGGSITKSYGRRDADDAINTALGVVELMKDWANQCTSVITHHQDEPMANTIGDSATFEERLNVLKTITERVERKTRLSNPENAQSSDQVKTPDTQKRGGPK